MLETAMQKLRGLPKFMKIICACTVGVFGLMGLGLSLKWAAAGGNFLAALLYFLLIVVVSELMVLGAYFLLLHLSETALRQKVSEIYQQRGYVVDMAKCTEDTFSFGDPGTMLQRVFFYLMAEDYENAEKFMLPLTDKAVLRRDRAMLNTCRLWLYMMTARTERAERLFQETAEEQLAVYQRMPDIRVKYRPELDDAIIYFMLASALSVQLFNGAHLSDYRGQFDFQLSKRCEADQRLYPEIYDLIVLYAKGDLTAAQEKGRRLRATVEAADTSIPYARRGDLLRLIEQARLFAKYVQTVTPADRKAPVSTVKNDPTAGILSNL